MDFEIKPRLLAPGPVPLPKEIRDILSQQMIHHRAPEFAEILASTLEKLKVVFQTKQPVMMMTSTGSGALEATVVNLINSGDEILAIKAGKFGERWGKMAEAYGAKVHWLSVEWGEKVDVAEVEPLLKQNPNINLILVQACETSTATLNPIKELTELAKSHNCLIAVDAITAIATLQMPMDEWGIDVVVAGSQKAFMLPTGLSFIALSEKAWERQRQNKQPKFYFNLESERKANEKGQTFFSSNVAIIRALHYVLEKWCNDDGLNRQIQRSQKLADVTHFALQNYGLKLLSSSPAPAVTAFWAPEGVDGGKLRLHIEEKYKVTLMGGQDHLKGKILRIGHMGQIENDDLLAAIYFLGKSLIEFGYVKVDDLLINNTVNECNKRLQE